MSFNHGAAFAQRTKIMENVAISLSTTFEMPFLALFITRLNKSNTAGRQKLQDFSLRCK